jgi:hypothetical protein
LILKNGDVVDNKIMNKVCIFAGKYSKLEQHLTVNNFSSHIMNRPFEYPEWFFPLMKMI